MISSRTLLRSFFATAVLQLQSHYALAQDNSTFSPSPCKNAQFFDQQIDHSAAGLNGTADSGTFKHQYQINKDNFKEGGPILLMIGPETKQMLCEEDMILHSWSKDLGAISASLEHRYFGKSLPFGNQSWTNDNLKYLTLENVMLDAVKFVEWMKATVSGAHDSKVIIAGGSYAGFLATVMRMNYPGTFYGALAAGGPVRGIGYDANNPDITAFVQYNSDVYMNKTPDVATYLRESWTELNNTLHNDPNSLKDALNLCTAPNSTVADFETIGQIFTHILKTSTQYNYRVARAGINSVPSPFDKVRDIARSRKNDSLALMKDIGEMWLEPLGIDCVDWADPGFIGKVFSLNQIEPFNYILCTYLPLVSVSGNDTVFVPLGKTVQEQINSTAAMCQKTYNVPPPMSQQEIHSKYHFGKGELDNSTRIIFSVSGYDCTTAIAPLPLPEECGQDSDASVYIMTEDAAHVEDIFPTTPEDHEGIIKTREKELEIIKRWVGMVTS